MNKLVDVMTYALGVGAILVLTRKGSQGPGFVKALGDSAANLVKAATGQ